ncbi:MAG: amidohydrolase [Gemmatimonadales bacterium]|nr:MAG: amidohydrolase [Gemmatimonadales bacterium]
MNRPLLFLVAGLFFTTGCATAPRDSSPAPPDADQDAQPSPLFEDPFPSTYRAFPSTPTLIRDATILTGTGEIIEGGAILLRDGRIAEVGRDVAAPAGATIIDGSGMWVTPGIIDTHSHLGVYASPGVAANADGNEMTNPNTAEVWAEHSLWPQDPGFGHALAGGTTSLQILPGSANLFGGRSVTVKNVPARTYQAMKFPGAPHGLKMACGENPKRVYGGQGRFPMTAMGNVAGYRSAWIEAERYRDRWTRWRDNGADPADRPDRNLRLETLAAVLEGDILVHNHCYRADEMVTMIDIAREFGYTITSFHHATEAYKIRDYLAEHDICASMWADWWGFKLEAYDAILQNVSLVHEAGACAIVHSDDGHGIQRLNQEAAKVLGASAAHGLHIPKEEAIAWITLNPARSMGIDEETGSLEAGKAGDVVLWSGDPFSVYTRAEKVFVDGALMYDRSAPDPLLFGDFMLGILPPEVVR